MGERTIEDIMRNMEELLNEAGSKGYKVGEIKAHFIDRSTDEGKKYETNEVLFEVVQ